LRRLELINQELNNMPKKLIVKSEEKKEKVKVTITDLQVGQIICYQHQLQVHPEGGGKHICVVCNKEF